jgi:hypothetical protein
MSDEKAEREHSKFSASGSERYLNCSGSVDAEEASPPSADTPWSLEGTKAHDLLEKMLHVYLYPENELGELQELKRFEADCTKVMKVNVRNVYWQILDLHKRVGGELIAEQRISQSFIHPEMFGTLDVGIIVEFQELHVIDLKYGKNHVVNPTGNTQMIQYALGLAEKYDWNFSDVYLHIMQPRCATKVEKWHKTWRLPMRELYKTWLPYFREAVWRVENEPELKAGNWCYWCRAKKTCPVRNKKTKDKVKNIFDQNPYKGKVKNGH